MWFPMRKEPPGFVGPWTFQSVNRLPHRSVDDVFSILLDDTALHDWHPQVTNIQWNNDTRAKGASRTVVFRDPLFTILLAGPLALQEEFDVWDETDTVKTFGFCITATTRPNCLTFRAAREEFKVETDGNGGAIFTRMATFEPSFAVRYVLGFLIYPHLQNLLERECPRKFEEHFGGSS